MHRYVPGDIIYFYMALGDSRLDIKATLLIEKVVTNHEKYDDYYEFKNVKGHHLLTIRPGKEKCSIIEQYSSLVERTELGRVLYD